MNMKTNYNKIQVDVSALRQRCVATISKGLSISNADAGDIFDQMLHAELSGKKTHGLVRIPWLLKKKIKGHKKPILYKTDGLVSHFDCSKSIGYLAANEIIGYIKNKNADNDVHIAVGHNIFPTGVIGHYARQLINDNIVFIFGTTPNLVKFSDEKDRRFGTNPFSAGLSYGRNKYFIFDVTTAQGSFGELLASKYNLIKFNKIKYHTTHNKIPKRIEQLFNSNGLFTGSILQELSNQSETRQFSLMLLVQLLTVIVSQNETKVGDLVFITLKKDIFGSKKVYENVLDKINKNKIPGMHGDLLYRINKKSNKISVSKKLWAEIKDLGSS